jgi:hypothetical protein
MRPIRSTYFVIPSYGLIGFLNKLTNYYIIIYIF